MTTIVKAQRPAEFLIAFPRMLGYQPVESIVVQTFQKRRTAATLRVDLPAQIVEPQRVADAIIRLICRVPAVDAVLIAIYTAERWSISTPPRAELVQAVVTRMASAGLGIVDALCSSENTWGSYLDDERGDLDDLRGTQLSTGLELSNNEDEVGLSRQGARALELRSRDDRKEVVAAARQITRDDKERERLWMWPFAGALWSDALETSPSDLPVPVIAALLWSIRDKGVRDSALMHIAWGGDAGDRAARDTEHLRQGGAVASGSILLTFVGEGTAVPGGLRIEGAIRLLRHLASLAPRSWTPAPLTMLAWCEWARGCGSAAGEYVDAALTVAPGYELARIFDELISHGRIPDWVGRAPQ